MQVFAEKTRQPQGLTSSGGKEPDSKASVASQKIQPPLHLQGGAGNEAAQRSFSASAEQLETSSGDGAATLIGHDFSRIPIYPSVQRKCSACAGGKEQCPACAPGEERAQRRPVTTSSTPVRLHRLVPSEETDESPETVGAEPLPATGEEAEPMQGGGGAPTCPTQRVTMGGARCGTQYGALGRYCYGRRARGWWFKERVLNGSPNTCDTSPISQTTTPIQSSTGCVSDEIFDFNGPPSSRAPCTDVTNQTVFAGPTQASVEQCRYSNTQRIDATVNSGTGPRSGRVTTTSAGVSTRCDWP